MKRVYFYCPTIDTDIDLVLEMTCLHHSGASRCKLTRVTGSYTTGTTLYVTEKRMNTPGCSPKKFSVIPTDYCFYINLPPTLDNEKVGCCTSLFPDYVKKHPMSHTVSWEFDHHGAGIEIHLDMNDDV